MKRQSSQSIISLALLLLLLAVSLFANELTYDMATGKQSGFLVNENDSDYNPNNYPNKGEVWSYHGFVGRLDYLGEPVRVTITNSGPTRTSPPNSMFYFTYNTNSTINTGRYREFFIVARAKGLFHNGSQDDFNGQNFVVTSSGGYFDITKGAGPESAVIGQIGYSSTGSSGTYSGSNSYVYKYPYSYIWIDVTLIRTNTRSGTSTRGYYETSFTFSTKNLQTQEPGEHYTMQLTGEYSPRSSQSDPWDYYFGVENLLPPSFPFSNLANKNSSSNTLTVGKVRYFSTNDTASLEIASNSAGTQTNFLLTSAGSSSFAYSVVYAPTKGQLPLVATTIASSTGAFNSINISVGSPIGGSNTGNFIEGEVKIFVAPNLLPLSGTYTSDIYCFLTRTN